jgi:homoserine kinase
LETIRVETTASIANFGPGFDTFGLCIDRPADLVEVQVESKPGIRIELAKGSYEVPLDPGRNTASIAAQEMIRLGSRKPGSVGLNLRINKKIRPGSGLGSSAASAVAGALGAAEALGVKDNHLILRAAAKGEGSSSGAPHLDNVSPCLYGGFTAIVDPANLKVLKIDPPDMRIVVCLPEMVVETSKARKLIPSQFSVKTTVSHVGWASGIIHGLMEGDIEMVASCILDDIAVPSRKGLIKGYEEVRKCAMDAGALSFSISGSGPAVFSLAKNGHEGIGKAIVKGFGDVGVKSEYFIAKPGFGAKLIQ